jgi:hypothetical protein
MPSLQPLHEWRTRGSTCRGHESGRRGHIRQAEAARAASGTFSWRVSASVVRRVGAAPRSARVRAGDCTRTALAGAVRAEVEAETGRAAQGPPAAERSIASDVPIAAAGDLGRMHRAGIGVRVRVCGSIAAPVLRSRVRRSVGFLRGRSRVKDTGIIRPGRLTRRRSAATATSATAAAARRAATATSATAAAARRVVLAVLRRHRLWVEAVGSCGRCSCPRHWRVAGRDPERAHRRGERTENPSFLVPWRSHRPTDEQHDPCPLRSP